MAEAAERPNTRPGPVPDEGVALPDDGLPATLGRSAAVMAVGPTLWRLPGRGRPMAIAFPLRAPGSRLAEP